MNIDSNFIEVDNSTIVEINGGYSVEYGLSGAMGVAAGVGSLAAVGLIANPVGAAAVGLFALGSWTAGVTSSTMAFVK